MRKETDGLGERLLPEDALYGIHSLRARENFPITLRRMDGEFIQNIARIKKAAALVNGGSGDLTNAQTLAIVEACDEVIRGEHLDAFLVDMMQGGAGTSANMNANEVIANLAILRLGGKCGEYALIHPIDHVNMYQSTNDVIPSAGRLTVYQKCMRLLGALTTLEQALREKAEVFDGILKVGRTQLQDAVPMRVGQTFGAYAAMVRRSIGQIRKDLETMQHINLGATAIGTGINASRYYFDHIVAAAALESGIELYRSEDLFDGTQNADDFATVSSAVKVCAIKLSKMASDLRLLSSGPNSGFCELHLPARQSGSSIMPGKVNPVLPEALNQAAFLAVGHDLTVTQAVEAGQLELNAFLPVVFFQLFEEIDVLTNAIHAFIANCLTGITVNTNKCEKDVEMCYSIVTALNPAIGYDKSTEIVKTAQRTGRTILETARELSGLPDDRLQELMDPSRLTLPTA